MTRPTPFSVALRIRLALVAGLMALGPLPAKAMLPRPAAQAPAEAVAPPALGFASFGENSILVLQPGSPCTACLTPETKAACGHALPATVVEYAWEGDRSGVGSCSAMDVWEGPPDLERMLPGPDSSLIVSGRQGVLSRIQLVREQGSWLPSRIDTFLGAAHKERLGLPAGPVDGFALGPAGTLVLVFGANVAWLPAAPADCAREDVRWLAGKAPAETKQDSAADPVATGLSVAVNSDGLVFLIDGRAASLTWVDPRTLKAGKLPWPGDDRFVLVSAHCLGRTLHLAGRKDAKAKATTLHIMRPAGKTYQWETREQSREFGAVLGASRDGRLLSSAQGGHGFILFDQAPAPAGEAKLERKQEATVAREAADLLAQLDSRLGKAADATYQSLLKEEAARDQQQRLKEKRKKAKARAKARARQQETAGAGAGAATAASAKPAEAPAAKAAPAGAGAAPEFKLNPHAKPFQPKETDA